MALKENDKYIDLERAKIERQVQKIKPDTARIEQKKDCESKIPKNRNS